MNFRALIISNEGKCKTRNYNKSKKKTTTIKKNQRKKATNATTVSRSEYWNDNMIKSEMKNCISSISRNNS